MNRREFLSATAVASLTGVSGCSALGWGTPPRISRSYTSVAQSNRIVVGQPTLDAEEKTMWGTLVASKEEASRSVYWKRWRPLSSLDPYRETDFSSGFLVFLVGVAPSGYDLVQTDRAFEGADLRYWYRWEGPDSRGADDGSEFEYVYEIHKWDLNGARKPERFELSVASGTTST